ncbi:MAG TPA: response regulator transcription factor [Anaerolineales bacterium]|nr:response regulator transcription factor [Anaerolineales bacterium]
MTVVGESIRRLRLIIAEDHAVVRQSLRLMLELDDEVDVVGEAVDGGQAVSMAQELHPDLVLMDIRMEGMDGVEATRRLKEVEPDVPVLILTGFSEDQILLKAVEAGAQGFLLKDATATEVKDAIRRVVNGESLVTPSLLRKLLEEFSQRSKETHPAHSDLTPREMEVLLAVAQGKSNEEIARALVISEKTVKTHLGKVFSKLQVEGRAQAMLYAIREGLVEV